jgi:hypothetical protein
MEAAEEFLSRYFQSRTETLREYLRVWEPHESRFFAPGYRSMDSGAATRKSQGERILTVTRMESGYEVVTSAPEPVLRRFKYYLSPDGDSWRIRAIDRECGVCGGSGRSGSDPCHSCEGRGWRSMGRRSDA